ncbi:hypothetical protein Scep_027329 [Stephania cephalantha]|uniref:Protodermal factor 1-like n=1 Tax=Stephania cephalantha TaxID=152367 RepID=A0AAP0ECD2_9MAGN
MVHHLHRMAPPQVAATEATLPLHPRRPLLHQLLLHRPLGTVGPHQAVAITLQLHQPHLHLLIHPPHPHHQHLLHTHPIHTINTINTFLSTPSTPSTPSYTPTPSTPSTPTPTTPTPVVEPPPTYTPTPVTPTTPTPPSPLFPIDPNAPPPFTGTCNYWSSHPDTIWALCGWWATIGGIFPVPTSITTPSISPGLTLPQALANTRTDGFGALYREGTASLLNSMVNSRFPYTTDQVRNHFVSALVSDRAASNQAELFKKANEGRLKPRA